MFLTNIFQKAIIFTIILFFNFPIDLVLAQDSLSADQLLKNAKYQAFQKKNYPMAIQACKEALLRSPDYSDVRIFLGRIYLWSEHIDSARSQFNYVLERNPADEDALSALVDLEYWHNNSPKALEYCQTGLLYHPQSEELLYKKAKILKNLKKEKEAFIVLYQLRRINPNHEEAKSLIRNIREENSTNKIGISYDFVYFDKQFNNPWHLASIDYKRQTKPGSITVRINYANRFKTNGYQYELDFYPRVSKKIYFYLSAGYSNSVGVFPKYRLAYSLYATLPKSFEAEGGIRYLYFNSRTLIYVASLGKYYNNYWFNFRTFLVPDNNNISQSYNLTMRYYFGGADDFIAVGTGTGISPDDSKNNIQLNSNYRLKSYKFFIGYRHVFKTSNIFILDATWLNQEYLTKTFGNQINLSIGYQRKL